jgi:hypothetical protein
MLLFVAKWMPGAFPPIDLWTPYLVQAMILDMDDNISLIATTVRIVLFELIL